MTKSRTIMVTRISQDEARILTRDDFDGYDQNCPGDKWELVEYIHLTRRDGKPLRRWVPNYTLQYDKVFDCSKVEIVAKGNSL